MTRMRSTSKQTALTKHTPQRTCLGCRQVRPKRELIRLLRTTDGSIEIDTSGKKNGRGTYLCRARECWEAGLKGDRLEHALRSPVPRDVREQLLKSAEELIKGVN